MAICSHQILDADNGPETNRKTDDSPNQNKLPELYFQEILDSSPDLITVLDKERRITYMNRAASDAIGCTPEQAIGLHCYQMFHHTDQPLVSCPLARLLQDGQVHQEEVYEKRLETWFLISVSPLYDFNGRLIGSIHSARDISLLKKSEQALRESEERYHQLSEATLEGVLPSEATRILAANQVLADMVGYDIINSRKGTKASTANALTKIGEQVKRIDKLTKKLTRITQYKTKDYAGGEQIIDIDLSASG
jgi:PAS domain S-box-containing protein